MVPQFTDDQMLRVYGRWAQLHPDLGVQDFAEFVRENSGFNVSDLLTESQADILMERLSSDPILAESLWEGMESGP